MDVRYTIGRGRNDLNTQNCSTPYEVLKNLIMTSLRSMLDSKNKVYQNIVKNIDVGGGLVPSEMAANMKDINEKFESTTDLAAHWDQVSINFLFKTPTVG